MNNNVKPDVIADKITELKSLVNDMENTKGLYVKSFINELDSIIKVLETKVREGDRPYASNPILEKLLNNPIELADTFREIINFATNYGKKNFAVQSLIDINNLRLDQGYFNVGAESIPYIICNTLKESNIYKIQIFDLFMPICITFNYNSGVIEFKFDMEKVPDRFFKVTSDFIYYYLDKIKNTNTESIDAERARDEFIVRTTMGYRNWRNGYGL